MKELNKLYSEIMEHLHSHDIPYAKIELLFKAADALAKGLRMYEGSFGARLDEMDLKPQMMVSDRAAVRVLEETKVLIGK